jgi:hypothetical protein
MKLGNYLICKTKILFVKISQNNNQNKTKICKIAIHISHHQDIVSYNYINISILSIYF